MKQSTRVKKAEAAAAKLVENQGKTEEPAPAAPPDTPIKAEAIPKAVDPPAELAPAAPAVSALPESFADRSLDYRSQFEVLHGKYSVEVPRLAQEKRELNDKVTALESEIETLRQAPVTPIASADDKFAAIEEEIGDGFGNQLKDAVETTVTAQTQALIDQVEGLQNTLNQLTTNDVVRTENSFFAALDDSVNGMPGWENTYNDEKFVSWAAQVEPFSGQTYDDLINSAKDKFDAQRVIAIFKAYLSNGIEAPAIPALEEQIVPLGAPGGGGDNPNPQARKWTKADAEKILLDIRKGKYKGRIEEAQKLVSEITSSLARAPVAA